MPYAWQEKEQTIEVESSRGKRLSVCGFLSMQNELVAYTTESTDSPSVFLEYRYNVVFRT